MEARELMLTNREGKRMPATVRLPSVPAKGTVVLLHGLGGWKDQMIIAETAEGLALDGYVTFAFDDSQGVRSLDARFYDATTSAYLNDIQDALVYVRAQSWFTGPLTLIGHSQGAHAAVTYTVRHASEVSRLVLIAPLLSWKYMWWSHFPFALIWILRKHQLMLGISGKRFALGRSWLVDFLSYDVNKDAYKVRVPTLIISAERDGFVATANQHRTFARRFSNASHSTISWANHDFDGHEDEVVATIKPWLSSS
jgi:alpha-beta hydrolase superfamily lysophospholipase